MPRSGPTTLALPPFTGATRRLILINVGVFFTLAIAQLVLPGGVFGLIIDLVELVPALVAHGELWQLLTYSFVEQSLFGTLFAMLTLWFTGPLLEDAYGSRWLYELYLSSAVGGALLASVVSFTKVFGMDPGLVGVGPYAAIYGLLIAIAVRFGDLEFLFLFIVRVRAKYMVAIFVLIDLATLLKSHAAFEALLHVCGALCGYLYLRFAPRRGLAYGATERWFALRNEYYRAKRRRAAKKFEVYMRKQNRDVRFDENGRYIDPDERRDPNDRKWMN